MPVSTNHKVVQFVETETDEKKKHPILKTGDYHVTGTIDHSADGVLCSPDAELSAEVVSLTRTAGGGIAYEFAISADEEPARAKKAADAKEAQEKAAADIKTAQDKAVSDAQAAQDASDARLAKVVAAAVKEALAAKA